jgi:hypothetical protein
MRSWNFQRPNKGADHGQQSKTTGKTQSHRQEGRPQKSCQEAGYCRQIGQADRAFCREISQPDDRGGKKVRRGLR